MPTLVSLLKYKIITSFYLIITDTNTDKFIDIYLKKFNYKKIFYKKKMTKFNKEKTVIKNLQDFIFLIISISIQKYIKGNKRNTLYKKLKILKIYLAPINYIQNLKLQNQYEKLKRIFKNQNTFK